MKKWICTLVMTVLTFVASATTTGRVVRLGVTPDRRPFSSCDATSGARPYGYDISVMDAALSLLGMRAEYVCLSEGESLAAIEAGTLDGIVGMIWQPSAMKSLNYLPYTTTVPMVMFGKKDAPRVTHLSMLRNKRIAIPYLEKDAMMFADFDESSLFCMGSLEKMKEAVTSGVADYACAFAGTIHWNNWWQNELFGCSLVIGEMYHGPALSKRESALWEKLRDALREVRASGEMSKQHLRWFDNRRDVPRRVRVAVDNDYAPFSYVNHETGKVEGFYPDLLRSFQMLDVELVPMPWAHVHAALEKKEVDMIAGIEVHDNYDTHCAFSQILTEETVSFYTSASNTTVLTTENLFNKYVIGVMSNTVPCARLIQQTHVDRIKILDKEDILMDLLDSGALDVVLQYDEALPFFEDPSRYRKVRSFDTYMCGIAVRSAERSLMQWIDYEVAHARANGTFSTLYAKHLPHSKEPYTPIYMNTSHIHSADKDRVMGEVLRRLGYAMFSKTGGSRAVLAHLTDLELPLLGLTAAPPSILSSVLVPGQTSYMQYRFDVFAKTNALARVPKTVQAWSDLSNLRVACLVGRVMVERSLPIDVESVVTHPRMSTLIDMLRKDRVDVIVEPIGARYAPVAFPADIHRIGVVAVTDMSYALHWRRQTLMPAMEEVLASMRADGSLEQAINAVPRTGEKPIILYISSSHASDPESERVEAAIAHVFPSSKYNVQAYYLNALHTPMTDVRTGMLIRDIFEKYAKRPLALALATDNAAFDILMQISDTLLCGVPKLFTCHLPDVDELVAIKTPSLAAVLTPDGVAETVRLMAKMKPTLRMIYLLNDATTRGEQVEAAWQKIIHDLPEARGVQVVCSANVPFEATRAAWRELPDDAMVLLGNYQSDSTGRIIVEDELYDALAKDCAVPVFTPGRVPSEKRNIVGGYGPHVDAQMTMMCALGKRLMRNGDVADVVAPGAWYFDQVAANAMGMDPDELEAVARTIAADPVLFLYARESWFMRYRMVVAGALLALSIALTALVCILLWYTRVVREERVMESKYRLALERKYDAEQHALHDLEEKNKLISEQMRMTEERNVLREELERSQRMESIGTFAGGIAHDFNNILTVITGYADLMLLDFAPDTQAYADISNIRSASDRATKLVKQLLAFAARKPTTARRVALKHEVTGLYEMLLRVIGAQVYITLELPDGLWPVFIDPVQVEQVLLNLVKNAVDAMGPAGGTIRIMAMNVKTDETFAKNHPSLPMGEYVMLLLKDTGPGISKEIQAHIFEPFFTTKGAGHGTGMGLATVYAIARQNGGCVAVDSEIGAGATFMIYLPRATQDMVDEVVSTTEQAVIRGRGETVLYVDDDVPVGQTHEGMLRSLGYTVVRFERPKDALAYYQDHYATVALVLSDVVMPEMNGAELVAQMRALNPTLTGFFISGYTSDILNDSPATAYMGFIQKPVTLMELSHRVAEALGGVSVGSEGDA